MRPARWKGEGELTLPSTSFAAVMLAACMVVCLAIIPTKVRADLMWGVNGHPFTAYPGISLADQLEAVVALGAKAYRVNVSDLSQLEQLGALVQLAKRHKLQILPVMTPRLDLDSATTAELYRDSYHFANAAVARLRQDVRVWELGNEMENYAIITACEMQDDGIQYNCAWGPAGGGEPSHYFTPRWQKVSAVLRGLSDGTAAADPGAQRAMGTAGWGHLGAFKRMRDDGIRWDISVWHYYEGDPEPAFRFLLGFGKPIWVTEFNHSGGSIENELEQANGLEQMIKLLRKYEVKYRIEAAFIYELFDEPYWGSGFKSVMGLFKLHPGRDGRWVVGKPKLAHRIVQRLLSSPVESTEHMVTASVEPTHGLNGKEPLRVCQLSEVPQTPANHANQSVFSFCLILGRLPAPEEQWQAILSMKSGHSPLAVVDALLESREFAAISLGPDLNDAEVVSHLYWLLLGRAPDGQGFRDFAGQLGDRTLSRTSLAAALAHSQEFRNTHPILFSKGAP